jgi:hypothetical protein
MKTCCFLSEFLLTTTMSVSWAGFRRQFPDLALEKCWAADSSVRSKRRFRTCPRLLSSWAAPSRGFRSQSADRLWTQLGLWSSRWPRRHSSKQKRGPGVNVMIL